MRICASFMIAVACIQAGCAAPGEDANYDTRELDRRDRFHTESGTGPTSEVDQTQPVAIHFNPVSGLVRHGPTYVADVPLRDDAIDVSQPPEMLWRMDEALLGARAKNWECQNIVDGVVEPLRAASEVALMPVRMVQQPPWTIVED